MDTQVTVPSFEQDPLTSAKRRVPLNHQLEWWATFLGWTAMLSTWVATLTQSERYHWLEGLQTKLGMYLMVFPLCILVVLWFGLMGTVSLASLFGGFTEKKLANSLSKRNQRDNYGWGIMVLMFLASLAMETLVVLQQENLLWLPTEWQFPAPFYLNLLAGVSPLLGVFGMAVTLAILKKMLQLVIFCTTKRDETPFIEMV